MIILPNTPPTPTLLAGQIGDFTVQLDPRRAVLTRSSTESYNDLVRYVVSLEEYIEEIFQFVRIRLEPQQPSVEAVVEYAGNLKLLESTASVPWKNISFNKSADSSSNINKFKVFSGSKGDWHLINEIEVSVLSTALVYVRLGAELVNELIEIDSDTVSTEETNEKWKQVVSFYKKAISFVKFGANISRLYGEPNHLNGNIYDFVERIAALCIQMSILSKSSWINRNSYNQSETFNTSNNGTLCRVAVNVVDELRKCGSLLDDIRANKNFLISINTNGWSEYLNLIEKYANAYAGLFLSIESYQQNKLGQAIGLLNFSLVNLQSKSMSDLAPKKSKILSHLKSKVTGKKNDAYIKNLQSITTLNLDNSLFNENSGIVLKDISFLFDQLIQLHLKFTKENDNLNFDTIADYQDVQKDGKWPLGSRIPVSDIGIFEPKALSNNSDAPGSSRRAYY